MILCFGAWLGQRLIPLKEGFLGGGGLGVWANFDGVHYLNIAKNGYANFEQTFFPAYPLLIRFLAPLFGNRFLLAGLFISHLCFLIALILLVRLLDLEFKSKLTIDNQPLIILLLFPTSFFFGAAYSEPLFLVLVLGAFLMARERKWFGAGILGGLASATRLAGIFLFPALLIEFWQKGGFRNWKLEIRNLLWLLLAPLGFVAYMIFLQRAFSDPLMFIHAQKAVGYRETGRIILLPQVFWRYLKIFFSVSPWSFAFWIAVFEFAVTILFLALILFSFSKRLLSYSVFMLLSVLIPTLTGTLNSLPRYVLTCFPGFVLLGTIKSRKLFLTISLGFLILLVLLTALFSRGYFIS
jgi:hypothetical protein